MVIGFKSDLMTCVSLGINNQEGVESDQCLTLISRFQSLPGRSTDHHLYCSQYENNIIAHMLVCYALLVGFFLMSLDFYQVFFS